MKNNYFIILIIIFTIPNLIQSQVTEIATGFNYPTDLEISGNYLFVTQATPGIVSKIDLTESTPTITDVVTGLNQPRGILIDGNTLYIAQSNNGVISKVDITETNPTLIDIATGFNYPTDLELSDNYLFVTQATPGIVSKIDLTESTPTITDIVTGLNQPRGILIDGNTLYIAQSTNGKILKYTDTTLSLNEYHFLNNSKIYPNPSNDYLYISNILKPTKFQIYDFKGAILNSGTINNYGKINIKNLTKGTYLIKLENNLTKKFIVE